MAGAAAWTRETALAVVWVGGTGGTSRAGAHEIARIRALLTIIIIRSQLRMAVQQAQQREEGRNKPPTPDPGTQRGGKHDGEKTRCEAGADGRNLGKGGAEA